MIRFLTLTAAMLLLASTCACTAPSFSIQSLGDTSWSWSSARAINNHGDMVLSSGGGKFLVRDGLRTSLGTIIPYAINRSGQVAGWSFSGAYSRSALWDTGVQTILPGLGGSPRDDYAYGINDAGQVAGYSRAPNGTYHACVWTNGAARDLGTSFSSSSFAYDINNSGQAVGTVTISGAQSRVVRWDDGVAVTLAEDGNAMSINDASHAAGKTSHNDAWEACLWRDSTQVFLGILPGFRQSYAYCVNASDLVVGGCESYDGAGHYAYDAFLWQSGTLYNLNDLLPESSGWDLAYAYGINDAGQIVGDGIYLGRQTAFVMTPVPEPSSLLSLSLATGAILAWIRRKRLDKAGRAQRLSIPI